MEEDTIGYCRVSSEGQVRDGHGLESYLTRLRRFGLTDEQIFYDVESGGRLDRVGFQKVLSLVRGGKIRRVVVPAFDRFSRLNPADWETTMQELRQYGVTLIFLDGGSMTFDNPDDLYIARMQAIGAAREREKIQWRSLQGYKHLRSEGRAVRACFGWIKNGSELNLNNQPYRDSGKTYYQIAREIIERFLGSGDFSNSHEYGNLDRTVAAMTRQYGIDRLGVWWKDFPRDITGLRKWLLNEVHQGHIVYFPYDPSRKQIAWNPDPQREQLITEQERSVIEELLRQNAKTRKSRDQIKNPLAGLMFCTCGAPMTTSRAGGRDHRYIICKGAYPRRGLPKTCDTKGAYGVKLETVNDAVICALIERASEITALGMVRQISIPDSPEILSLKQQIKNLEALQDPDLASIIKAKQGKLIQLQEQRRLQSDQDDDRLNILVDLISKTETWHYELTTEEKRTLYQELVECLIIDRGKITVKLRV